MVIKIMQILLSLILALLWVTVFNNGLLPILQDSSLAYSLGAFPSAVLVTILYTIGFIPLLLSIINRKKNLEEKKIKQKNRKPRYHFFKGNEDNLRPIRIDEIYTDYKKNKCEGIDYFVSNKDVDPNLKTKIDIFDYIKKYRTDDKFFLGVSKGSLVSKTVYYLEIEPDNLDKNIAEQEIKSEDIIDTNKLYNEKNNVHTQPIELDEGIDIKNAKKLLSKHYKIPIKDIEIHLKG